MKKKGNPLILTLVPVAMLLSCITGTDNGGNEKATSKPTSAVSVAPAAVEQRQTAEQEVAARSGQEGDTQCKVVGVADGDTLTCLTADKQQIKVRLHQIDAPEQKQDFGQAAKKALSGHVYRKNISLKMNGRDKYGRTIAEVYVDGKNINKAMVEAGYAWAYREHMTDNEYLSLENAARNRSRGLWSQPNPVYPSEFRHKERPREVTQDVKPKAAANGKFSCDGKRFCREMRSCDEARFYLNKCGESRLDRDNDGIPCESLC